MKSLRFDLDINARCNRKHFQLVDRVEGWVQEIEHADMRAHLELLARLSVDVRRAQNRKDLAFCWQGDRPYDASAGALRCFDNIRCRTIQLALIVRFETDADSFSWLLCSYGLYFLTISSWIFVGTRSKWLGSIV